MSTYGHLTHFRCAQERIGNKLINLNDTFGYLIIPDNQTSEFTSLDLKINGKLGLYGKSILLEEMESGRKVMLAHLLKNKKKTINCIGVCVNYDARKKPGKNCNSKIQFTNSGKRIL